MGDDVVQNAGKKARFMDGEEEEGRTERRRWEELEPDCLTNILSRVGMESLLLAVPFVCKSWYKTTLNPLCWLSLRFPDYVPCPLFIGNVDDDDDDDDDDDGMFIGNVDDDDGPRSFGPFYDKFIDQYGIDKSRFSITAFVKCVVNRGCGNVTLLDLPEFCTEEAVRYVSDECPRLKVIWFRDDLVMFKSSQIIPEVIAKWKLLESVYFGGSMVRILKQIERSCPENLSKHFMGLLALESPLCYNVLDRILVQIGTHCKYFTDLNIFHATLGEVEATTIANSLPNLQSLFMRNCRIERDSVVMLLRGCKHLVLFDAQNCEGFEEGDGEISELASHIDTFFCRSSQGYKLLALKMLRNVRKLFFMLGVLNRIDE
ncbi:hypothetical protein ABKV19_018083 [Rosa sericea]